MPVGRGPRHGERRRELAQGEIFVAAALDLRGRRAEERRTQIAVVIGQIPAH
jgi:hypothetical protein